MSYNGYNQYSPYWQQNAGQSTPQNTAHNVAQSRPSYQPLSAYQSNQQHARPAVSQPAESSSGASYSTEGYGNISYTGTNDRASLDGATTLGNLAYASSLGRNGPAPQLGSYSRQQGNSKYGTASPYGTIPTPPIQSRTDAEQRKSGSSSRDDTSARAQQATASPSFGYSSNNAAYQGPSPGNTTQTQTQHPHSGSASEQYRSNPYSQQPRPTSAQAIQQSRSRPNSRAAPTPTMPPTQSAANQSQGTKPHETTQETNQTRVQTPQQSTYRPSSSQLPGPPGGSAQQRPQTQQDARESGTKPWANGVQKSIAATNISAKEKASKRIANARQSPTVDADRQASKPATPVEPQYTTVDPSQVFNHVEYSRRQAAAAAEVAATKKAVEEAEAVRRAATQTKLPQVNGNPDVVSAPGTEPDSATKDQMELEMKQMIEKMRDYKAKDPSLFTQIWEQVKKGQPPPRTPSQSLQGSATSPIVVNGQLPSPSLIQSQLPPQSDLQASGEFPPEFDRGRFPWLRRKRGGGVRTSTGRKSGTSTDSTEPVDQVQTAENQRSPVPPELAIPTPKIDQIFPDPRSQSMQQAMEQFHQNSNSPVPKAQNIPRDNKQAKTKTSTSAPKASPSTAPPSQPVPAQSAPLLKPGGTYWPESKKKALAEAARIALTSSAPNQGKSITTQEIHELLDQNPSYIQMCEILEYRGFVIDRGHFARTLLKAVPDLGSAASPANAASINTTNGDRATPTDAPPTGTTPNTTATSATPTAGSFGMLVKATANDSAVQIKTPQPLPFSVPPAAAYLAPNAYVTPYAPAPPSADQASGGNQSNGAPREYRFSDPQNWTPGMPRHPASIPYQGRDESVLHAHQTFSVTQQPGSTNGQALEQNEATHPNAFTPHPTKQEMARKRTFDEIVDLTQTPDEEELERHRPKPRPDDENAFGPSKYSTNSFDQAARHQQNIGRSTPKPFKYKYSGRDALLQSYDIVAPMNKRRDALRRSTYNAKTIARDILLGIGKHPAMAPLNAHLDILKDKFKAVDNESDLSTFRWDLVDPEEEATVRRSDTDDEEAYPIIAPETHQRPAPVAVMLNFDGGDVATEDHTPSRMVNPDDKQSKRGPYKKSKIRSDVQPIGSATTTEQQPSQNSPPTQELNKASGASSTDLSRFAYNGPYTSQTNTTDPNASSSSTPSTASKRKGRPPGAKNKQVRPDKGIPKKRKTLSMGATPSTLEEEALSEDTTAPTGKPMLSETPSTERPSSPLPTRPRINTTTPSRPSGLRNSISAMTPTDGIAVVIPSRSPSVVVITPQASAKRGRPKKLEDRSEDGSNVSPSSLPTYTMYPCRWENCPAELHNLETLKKHVKKHRRDIDGVYPCLWADCSDSSNPLSNNTESEDGQYKRLKFKTDAEWVTHVESNHLRTKRELSAGVSARGSIV